MTAVDNKIMFKALRLASKAWGKTSPNPMVGAVIIKKGEIVGEGYHKKAGGPHAEINAINSVYANFTNAEEVLMNSSMYVTLEPCSTYGRTPPCTEAIIKNKITKVVIGVLDPNPKHAGAAVKILQGKGIDVLSGIEEKKCVKMNEAFFYWIVNKKPFILLKMAMTLDGKIATAGGDSKWVTGPIARKRVQYLRKWADAVLVGGETARTDRPSLTVRNSDNRILKSWKQPLRLIASNTLQCSDVDFVKEADTEIINAGSANEWNSKLSDLAAKNITSILVEGGGELASSLLEYELINKVEFHIAPKILSGRNSRPVIGGADPMSLANSHNLKDVCVKKLGDDISISGYVK
ncbi:MAG TPA: bifunctional diaminohydroxyphosphoribosylaminopyrimidine deaminase/5-amino-6-(5-phosphoribosylamino)uracil reductase RibD [Victivallales bacterium]|nr:bifunctional diaminohydroxyphosphoribosylaminopyrimidine deaminase/5-amino-6-(5-phosphoribosylamino)uracil reductase RibD [Victivallales bacterium]